MVSLHSNETLRQQMFHLMNIGALCACGACLGSKQQSHPPELELLRTGLVSRQCECWELTLVLQKSNEFS